MEFKSAKLPVLRTQNTTNCALIHGVSLPTISKKIQSQLIGKFCKWTSDEQKTN